MSHELPLTDLSQAVSPRDDLWRWVNERWVESDPIPADRARYGLSDAKRARIAGELRDVVQQAAGDNRATGAVVRLYALATDAPTRDAAGCAPIADELAAVAAVRTPADVLRGWGQRQREGVSGPFQVSVLPREDDARRWQVSLFQSGLTLPSPRMYGRFAAELAEHAERLFAAAGHPVADAAAALDLEGALAQTSWPNPHGDSDEALHHPSGWTDLAVVIGGDLTPYAEGLAVPAAALRADAVWNICQPSYAQGLARLLQERPVEQWRSFLTWRVLAARAPQLTTSMAEEHARFHGCVLAGQAESAPSWRRAVDLVQQSLPMDLARAWVARYLTDEARERTRALTEDLRAQLRRTLQACSWLGDASTEQALAKLEAVVLNVGWPREWQTIDRLDATDLVTAVRTCAAHAHDTTLARLDGPVDRGLWGPPPFVVNTFYHPFYNQVTVEGASLPPVQVLDDLPVLLGQYGSIIGHELGHAFDSRGATRDPEGRLREWWTPGERAAFTERADAVAAQVTGYRPRGVEDAGVDGALVGFECVAELIGYQLAWDAYCATTTAEQRAERVDGYTGAERFFIAKAYGRRATDRPRTARNRLESDVHPPFEVFADLARNLDAFHDTFGTRPGDGMWLDPADRIRIF